jgi:hypothetical protein
MQVSVKSDDFRSCGLSQSKWLGSVPGSVIEVVFGDAGFV